MANETTTGTLAAHIATEALAKSAIEAALPRMVATSLAHKDSIDGVQAAQKRYMVNSDLGAASAGTEAVALTPTIAIGMGTSVTVNPTEGVADMALITEEAVMEALGVPSAQVERLFVEGTQDQFMALLAPIVGRLIPRGMQKIEADVLALLSGHGTSVGTSGADVTIANLLAAIYQYRINQAPRPIGEARFLLAENQAHEVNLEALSASGGVAGAIWGSQANYGVGNKPSEQFEVQGLLGTFLNYPVHTYDAELNVTANGGADVVGGFGVFGVPGVAPDAPTLMGKCGSWVVLDRAPLSIRYQPALDYRAAKVVMRAIYGVGELVDRGVVAIVTDAP